jgi:peptide chain release factor 1
MTLDDFKLNPRTMYIAQEYERLLHAKEEAETLLIDAKDDAEMKELAEGEINILTPQLEVLWKQMEDSAEAAKAEEEAPKAMILEIQGGAGGDESSLFAAELALMYQNYAESRGWGWGKLDFIRSKR